jgi:hypothetical protein
MLNRSCEELKGIQTHCQCHRLETHTIIGGDAAAI